MNATGPTNEAGDLEGGCLCGAVRYRAGGEPCHLTHCHCNTCRRASAAAFVTWFSVPADRFAFTRGSPASYRSSARAMRGFCASCGTQLTFQLDEAQNEIDVTVCSLDDPEAIQPQDHTYTRSRLSWVKLADGLPGHATTRPES